MGRGKEKKKGGREIKGKRREGGSGHPKIFYMD